MELHRARRSGRTSDETKRAHPEVDWVAPVRLRNRIVHGFWSIDVDVLMATAWPGNTAELRDVLRAAADNAGPGGINVQDIPALVLKRAPRRQLTPMEQAERNLIIDALASVQNNRTEAARVLGIGRATLYRKLRALEISSGC